MNQQTQADVIDEQFQNWSSKNLVDGRMAWARLRTQSHKNSSIETILQTLQNQKKEKETTNQPQWPGGEGVKQDMACALLSEAAEIFVKRLVTASISSCNDTLDLDGIRYHLMQKLPTKPPLGMVMSCDVGKQLAKRHIQNAKAYKKQETHLKEFHNKSKEKIEDWGDIDQAALAKINDMQALSKKRSIDNEVANIVRDVKRLETFVQRGNPSPFGQVPKGRIEVEEKHVRMALGDMRRNVDDGRGMAIAALARRAGLSLQG